MRKEDFEPFKKSFESYLYGLIEKKRLSKNELSQFLNLEYSNFKKAESIFRKFKKFLKDKDYSKDDYDKVGLEAIRLILLSFKIQKDAENINS